MSPENVCPRFKQNAWKKDLCSNCFRPKEEHPEKPKRVHVDYKPLPEISPTQSILKVNGSCDKSRNVSFSNVEFEVIGYGGEEYSTDEDYSSDDGEDSKWVDSGDDEELKRLTEVNTNLNGKLIVPDKVEAAQKTTSEKAKPKSSPPLITVQPFGEPPKSLVFNFLKNKEIAAVAAAKEAVQKNVEKKNTAASNCTITTTPTSAVVAPTASATEGIQLRKTETKKPSLTRNSLVANSNEPYLNIKRSSLQQTEQAEKSLEIPSVKLHPPSETINAENQEENEIPKDDAENTCSGVATTYKPRSNVPRMGTMHFKLKLGTVQKPAEPPKPSFDAEHPVLTASESLTSREMAGEPDGKADSDEPSDPITSQTTTGTPMNRSFLHKYNKNSSLLSQDSTSPPRTPPKKMSITSNNSPPECPRSIKRQAPKPPPTPISSKENHVVVYHSADSSFSDEESFKPVVDDVVSVANRKLLAEYCEQIEKEQNQKEPLPREAEAVGDVTREPSTLPLANRRPSYEKKKFSKAGRVGLKIKKFLRIPSRESNTPAPQLQSPRPKLEIIHPLDINKSAVEIIHNSDGLLLHQQYIKESIAKPPSSNYYPARPTKPPPPPRSLPPVLKSKCPPADYVDSQKTCDSSTSDETYEPLNFSAPECDHSSPEMARLTSMQYYGSETESDIYPTIQFGDDFGAEDSIRNAQLAGGHKSLEESYDAVVVANHEALTKLLDQATCGPKIPKELIALKTQSLDWSNFHVEATSRLLKAGHAFYNAKWYDVPVVLSVSARQVKLNNVLNNHFVLTKVTQFVAHVGQEFAPGSENEQAYVTLWNAHRIEGIESYCKEYNAKYADVTKEAGLILVETVTVLLGLQAADVHRYSTQAFVVTRNSLGADPTVAVVQLATDFEEEDTLCEVMLKVLRLLAPTWEMTVCLSQVLCQDKPNSLSKCKALLELWLWGPTAVTVSADRPLSLKRWLDLERANNLHGHVCSRSTDLSAQQICYMSFLVTDDDALFSDAARTMLADRKTLLQLQRDPTISKC